VLCSLPMALKLEDDQSSIVVVGGSDPLLLHPACLGSHGRLGEPEAEQRHIKVVHPDITEWSRDSQPESGGFESRFSLRS
jgi:hypothetical protein